MNIDDALASVDQEAPFIVAFGISSPKLMDFKVIVEKLNILPMPSLATALHCCFAAYYIYNIQFPLEFSSILLFLEKYVYKLRSSKKLPLSVTVLIDNLEKI